MRNRLRGWAVGVPRSGTKRIENIQYDLVTVDGTTLLCVWLCHEYACGYGFYAGANPVHEDHWEVTLWEAGQAHMLHLALEHGMGELDIVSGSRV